MEALISGFCDFCSRHFNAFTQKRGTLQNNDHLSHLSEVDFAGCYYILNTIPLRNGPNCLIKNKNTRCQWGYQSYTSEVTLSL